MVLVPNVVHADFKLGGLQTNIVSCSFQLLSLREQRALASASIVLSPKVMTVARHVAHSPSSIFSPADNGTLW